MKKSVKPRGFTLIELLVAISILAIVAVLGWRGLDSIVRAREILSADLEQTRGLQLAFAQIQSDSTRIAKAEDIGGRPILQGQPGKLTLVRTVFADNQPSHVQVISYRLVDGVLSRRESLATRDLSELDAMWKAALADTGTVPPVVLQSNVEAMTIRSWIPQGMTWVDGATSTPAPSPAAAGMPPAAAAAAAAAAGAAMPTGLELTLRLRGHENDMVKIFLLGTA